MWKGPTDDPVVKVIVTNLPKNATRSQIKKIFLKFKIIQLELLPPNKPILASVTLSSDQYSELYGHLNNKPPHFLNITVTEIPEQVKETGSLNICEDDSCDEDELEGDIIKEVNQSDFRFHVLGKDNAILGNELEEATVTEPKHINSRKENVIAFCNSEVEEEIEKDDDGSDKFKKLERISERLALVDSRLGQERKNFRELKLKIETILKIAEDIRLYFIEEKTKKFEKRDIIIVEEIVGTLKLGHRNIETDHLKNTLSMAAQMIETSLLEAEARSMDRGSARRGEMSKEDLEARWREARETLHILGSDASKSLSLSLCTVEQILTDCQSWLGDWVATVLVRQTHTGNAKDLLSKEFDKYTDTLDEFNDVSAIDYEGVVQMKELEAAMQGFEEAADQEVLYYDNWEMMYLQRLLRKVEAMLKD